MRLEAQHLSKQYKHREVVKDISLRVETGEIVGLLGPNGAGKTTSFYMLVGLIAPSKGEVYLDTQAITTLPIHARAQAGLGYLPQEPSIFRALSVRDNILAILQIRYPKDPLKQADCLEQLLEEFHLQSLADQKGISLSGGERRRVEIARTLAMDPKFVLLDEPFAGIDPIAIGEAKRWIHNLKNKDIGVLITDHNVRETLAICDRAYIVNQGEILCEGTTDVILNNPAARKVYLGEDFDL